MVNQTAVNRIDLTFSRLKKLGEKALITYVMAGDPSVSSTLKIIEALEAGGSDIVELGVPFTDPLADGPVIQKAAARGLKSGATLARIFSLVRTLRKKSAIPVILMSYYNPILQYGEEKFRRHARKAGVDGVIIPDLPAGELPSFSKAARKSGLKTIFLLAPTSSPGRIRKVAKESTGFIYYVPLTGITGSKLTLSREIGEMTGKIKKASNLPVAIGFGVSNPREARAISRFADGVIVGSAIVRRIEETPDASLLPNLKSFIRSLKKALQK